jgi:hypothetical protein
MTQPNQIIGKQTPHLFNPFSTSSYEGNIDNSIFPSLFESKIGSKAPKIDRTLLCRHPLKTELVGDCRIIEPSGSSKVLYFINESPLPNYDPWMYLKPSIREVFDGKMTNAIQICFPVAINEKFFSIPERIMPQQVCSYMLGYGPTWEAYIHRISWPQQLKKFEHLHD